MAATISKKSFADIYPIAENDFLKSNLNRKHYLIEISVNFYCSALQINFEANPYETNITRNAMGFYIYLYTMKHFEITKSFIK